ncbi:21091_t:CDS:2, partial [Gigaspora rosea]
DCSYFAVKHSPEQIQNIINMATSTSKKLSTTSTHSSSSLFVSNNFLKKQTTLSQYIGRPLNASEVPKFERLVLRAIISTGVAFRWIENPEVRELFQFIAPYLKLPDQRSLGNRILMNATNEVQKTIKDLACDDKIGVTIAFDGWRNVVNQELMGIVFITSSGETLIWGAEDISIERQRKEEVIFRIRNLFEE